MGKISIKSLLFISIIFSLIFFSFFLNINFTDQLYKLVILINKLTEKNFILMCFFYSLFVIFSLFLMLPLPPFFKPIAAGLIFGTYIGVFISVISVAIGTILFIEVARSFFYDFFEKKINKLLPFYETKLKNNEFIYIFLMRLIPGVPFFIQNSIISILKSQFKNYIPATILGVIPANLLMCSIGNSINETLLKHEFKLIDFLNVTNLSYIFLYAIFVLIIKLISKRYYGF